ncbi:P-loop containing nucleoside triphosphate hydrolase protein [Pelagophyceae sp. CCMP2097]|nr:P-loop containing nucleoside triphosphate hydrolase protein [Pelagophyceae sp. CCMP2097]
MAAARRRSAVSVSCVVIGVVAAASLALRVGREHALLRGEASEAAGQKCTHAAGRLHAGSVVSAACANVSNLDAGVCVEVAGAWTRKARCIPSLAVIGAMKSGTTNIMLYLSLHPKLRTSENALGWPIETRFFSQATSAAAANDWRGYIARYPAAPLEAGLLTFDKSPNYLVNPNVPRVLHRLAPSIKLLVMLRDPTRRAYSHFQHECRNGRMLRDAQTKRTFRGTCGAKAKHARRLSETCRATRLASPCQPEHFDDMVNWELRVNSAKHKRNDTATTARAAEPWTCAWSLGDGLGDSNVIPRGLYACQLSKWLALYPSPAKLLALVFEEFLSSREATLRAVAAVEDHLGIPHYDYANSRRVSLVEQIYAAVPSRQTYAPMRADTKATLDGFYCEPNAQLAKLLGRALPWPCAEV